MFCGSKKSCHTVSGMDTSLATYVNGEGGRGGSEDEEKEEERMERDQAGEEEDMDTTYVSNEQSLGRFLSHSFIY